METNCLPYEEIRYGMSEFKAIYISVLQKQIVRHMDIFGLC